MFKPLKKTFEFIYFLFLLNKNKTLRNQIIKKSLRNVAVLANGPSLKEVLPEILIKNEFKDVDFIVLNFFAFEKTFFNIKPKHYCLADPMFFKDTHRRDNVLKLFKILEKDINWKMNIYIPKHSFLEFINYSNLKNLNITIIPVNTNQYYGYEIFRNYFYKKGLSTPKIQTVANLAIYVGINFGYSKINLYGLDHSFFHSLSVNDKNEVCNRETHFYTNQSILQPIRRNDNDELWKISDYIEAIMTMFKSHDLLNDYAIYSKVEIINFTKNSLVDSYKRYEKGKLN